MRDAQQVARRSECRPQGFGAHVVNEDHLGSVAGGDELGICKDDERWLIHIDGKHSRVEPEKLSRRHLTLTAPALVRLLMGHTSITMASDMVMDRPGPTPLF